MKNILLYVVVFCAFVLPSFAELSQTDLDKIRLLIQEENKPIKAEITSIKADIVSLKTDTAWIRGKLEGIEKQGTHSTNVTYGLIALIVAGIGIPQIIVALRSGRVREQDRKIEVLTQEIETLKQQRIVSP